MELPQYGRVLLRGITTHLPSNDGSIPTIGGEIRFQGFVPVGGISPSVLLLLHNLQVTVLPDTNPPATAVSVAPTPNTNGWNNGSVTVSLAGVDNMGGSGVKQIDFSLSGAQQGSGVVKASTASVTVSAEGSTTVTYF